MATHLSLLNDMKHFYHDINGYFNYENVYNYFLDRCEDNAQVVEIGVWQGKSVCYAAVESIIRNKKIMIHAVDTFEGSPNEPTIIEDLAKIKKGKLSLKEIFIENIEPVKHLINVVHMDSVSASKLYSDKSLDMVFIDGSHLYEAVYSDIESWLPKVKVGGIIAGHDIDGPETFNGVREAVEKFFKNDFRVLNPPWASWLHEVKNNEK
jgi:hypothetical protein